MKVLPIGVQHFERIRTKDYLYVDKTKYLIDLIDSGDTYFLARPRRFGKSLIVSTYVALFSGKKELFKGLYAEEFLNRDDFKPSPVIWLDMSSVDITHGMEIIEQTIVHQIRYIAERADITLVNSEVSSILFKNLILQLSKKYNQKVVILIDEYDAPYINLYSNTEMAEKVRDLLRSLYGQIKSNSEFIKFTFITGISKFARFGVFSTLNNLEDISLHPKYAEICGLTETEILQHFPDYLQEIAVSMDIEVEDLIEKMRKYYNGFSFDVKISAKLYNPFSTLLFLKQGIFFNFWMESGSIKFISDYLKNRKLTAEQFRMYPISIDFAKSPGDIDTATSEAFLYQAGYLTLREGTTDDLSLDYPNTEVLNSVSRLFAENLTKDENGSAGFCKNELLIGLMKGDCEIVVSALNRLLAGIPYDDFAAAARQSIFYNSYKIKPQEWLYRSTILAFLRGCGVVVYAEMHTNKGRSDLILKHKNQVWVLELKVVYEGEDPHQKAVEALQQIKEKNYAAQYPNAICAGIVIEDNLKQINTWITDN